jgi:uncharacterized membrane protein AbrB (regulator of aidB expression)
LDVSRHGRRWSSSFVIRVAMILPELLLAGFLRWVGLPVADLKLVTDTLCWVPGGMELAQFAGRRPEERK